jgi:hypothetical protein
VLHPRRRRPLRSISGRKCSEHRIGEPCPNTYVECAAVETLAVFGDPEGGALQHRVGLGRPIGGEDACALRITCIRTGDATRRRRLGTPFLHIDTGPVRNWDLDENGLGSLLFDGQRLRFNDKER